MQANAAGLGHASEKFQTWAPRTAFFQLESAKEYQFTVSKFGELWLSAGTCRELFEASWVHSTALEPKADTRRGLVPISKRFGASEASA